MAGRLPIWHAVRRRGAPALGGDTATCAVCQTGRDAGMIPLERSLARLLETGAVAPAVVKAIAADHDLLAQLSARLR